MFNFLGEKAKKIKIVANHAEIKNRTWKIIWRDDR
jgi:predicted component of type VI protein secretion system